MAGARAIKFGSKSVAARLAEKLGNVTSSPAPRLRVVSRHDEREELVSLIEEMVASDEELAEVATSVGTLLRSRLAATHLTELLAGTPNVIADVDDTLTADDVLRIARVRGEAQHAILSEGMFEASAVAAALGSKARNPREFARQLRAKPGVIALRVGNRYVFPAFQFGDRRPGVRAIVEEINTALGAASDPWGVTSWWFTFDSLLGARPADVVGSTARSEDLRAAAARELTPID